MRIALAFLALPALAQLPDGDRLFHQNCAAGYCHGSGGAAARGPRLKDRQFTREYLTRITRDGIPRSAMPGWAAKLSAAEIDAIVSYILKLNNITDDTPVAPKSVAAPPAAALDAKCAACHNAELLPVKPPFVVPTTATRLKRIRTRDGDTFPALIASETGGIVVAWDFTEPPPVRRSLDRAEIDTIAAESTWKHP